jgi:hypothetical protein
MADNFVDNEIYEVFAGGNPRTELGLTGEASIYPGHAIRDDNGTIYLAKNSDKKCSGVMAKKRGVAIDVAYGSGDIGSYYPTGFGAIVWVYLKELSPAAAIRKGDIAVLSATDGQVSLFAFTDSTDYLDTLMNAVGRVHSYNAGHVSAIRLVKLVLNI